MPILRRWLGLLCFLLPLWVQGQVPGPPIEKSPDGKVRAKLEALDKMIMVGKPFKAQLEVTHPADMVVIFPDTGGGFLPFELNRRTPQPTRTEGEFSTDFVIYDLWSWEIDSLQYLQLPVRYIQGKDTLTLLSNTEELNFLTSLPTVTDSLKFKRIDNLAPIGEPIAWGAWAILIAVLGIVLVGLFLLLYKPVLKRLRRNRIEREWKRYQKRHQQTLAQLPNQQSFLLELARVWKAYLDRDWRRGLGSLSTLELKTELGQMEHIASGDKDSLYRLNRTADMATYGGQAFAQNDLDELHRQVGQIMQKEYQRRKEAVEL